MNRNAAIALVVIVLLVVSGVVFFVAPLLLPKSGMSITVTFYDEDDNVVFTDTSETGLWEFSFKEAVSGAIVSYLTVETSWTVTAIGDPNSWVVDEDLVVTTYVTYDPGTGDEDVELIQVNQVTRPALPIFNEDIGSRSLTLQLTDLIPDPDMSEGTRYGWSISFVADWSVTGTWIEEDKTDTATDSAKVAFGIGWSEPAQSMSIIGTISKG